MTKSELVTAARMCAGEHCDECPMLSMKYDGDGCVNKLLRALADAIDDYDITVNQYGKNCTNITNLGTLNL